MESTNKTHQKQTIDLNLHQLITTPISKESKTSSKEVKFPIGFYRIASLTKDREEEQLLKDQVRTFMKKNMRCHVLWSVESEQLRHLILVTGFKNLLYLQNTFE